MSKHIKVIMPDDSEWVVPAKIVADNRAKYYASVDDTTDYQTEFDFAMDDDPTLLDWASGDINWDEVEAFAVKVKEPALEVDYQEGWVNGEQEIIDYGTDSKQAGHEGPEEARPQPEAPEQAGEQTPEADPGLPEQSSAL